MNPKSIILALIEKYYGVGEQEKRLDRMESEAKADVAKYAADPFSDKAKRAISEASATLTLVAEARNKIAGVEQTDFARALDTLVFSWNEPVRKKRDELEARLRAATLKAFDGDESANNQFWSVHDLQNVRLNPALYKYREAIYETAYLYRTDLNRLIGMAKGFMRFMDKHAKIVGVDPEKLVDPLAKGH